MLITPQMLVHGDGIGVEIGSTAVSQEIGDEYAYVGMNSRSGLLKHGAGFQYDIDPEIHNCNCKILCFLVPNSLVIWIPLISQRIRHFGGRPIHPPTHR